MAAKTLSMAACGREDEEGEHKDEGGEGECKGCSWPCPQGPSKPTSIGREDKGGECARVVKASVRMRMRVGEGGEGIAHGEWPRGRRGRRG